MVWSHKLGYEFHPLFLPNAFHDGIISHNSVTKDLCSFFLWKDGNRRKCLDNKLDIKISGFFNTYQGRLFLSTRKFIVGGALFYMVKLRGIRTPLNQNDFMFIGNREGLVVKGLVPLWSGLFSCTLRLIWAEFDFATCFFLSYFLWVFFL